MEHCIYHTAAYRVQYSKYPPAEPEALRLLAPQRGLFATVESKSNRNSKNDEKQNQGILPELSNSWRSPGRALSITHKFSAQDDAELNVDESC